MTMTAGQRILVIKLGALGDFVQAFGPMQAIRRHHPAAHITLLTTKPYVALAQQSNLFNDIWIDTKPKWYQLSAWRDLRRKMNRAHFTRVYDLQNSDRTAMYWRMLHPRPEWVGAARGASHENNSPKRTAGHSFDGHQQTLALAGIESVTVDPLDWMQADMAAFNLPPRYVLIIPGASPTRPLKRWPASSYAALSQRLMASGLTPVILGSADDTPIARHITAQCPQAVDLTGRTAITDVPALARGAAFAVGNDTGPMHLIAPTGCACLALFSADSHPVKHKPLGPRVLTLQADDLKNLGVDAVWRALADNGLTA